VPTSPRALQQKKLTEGNLDLFKANQSDVNSKAGALDAISSINSRVVQERLKKFTQQLLNPENVTPIKDTQS
jgi:peroxiredoxin